jgi:hypothetical protein
VGSDVGVAAAAGEPVHVGLAAEPGELAFGVVAMALLGMGDGLLACELAAEDGGCFGVAQGGEGAAGGAVTSDEAFGLFDEAAAEHAGGAVVDALVEAGAGRVEAEVEDAVAGEGVATLLPLDCDGSTAAGAERLACGEGDFDGANDFGDVVGVDGGGGGGVEPGEDAVEVGGAASGGEDAEAFALAGCLGRGGEEAVDEGPEVEAGAAGDDGEVAAFGDAGEGFACLSAVVAGGAGLVGPGDVDHVVLDEGALVVGGLGGADLHLAVDGYGVAADDLAVEGLGEVNGEGGFAAGGGAGEDDEGVRGGFRLLGIGWVVVWGVYHRRHQPGRKTLWKPMWAMRMSRTMRARRRSPRTWRRRSICVASICVASICVASI